MARETPGVAHTVGISGQSLLLGANAPNFGSMYVMLEEFDKRRGAALRRPTPSPPGCASDARRRCARPLVSIFGAPPVDGLGNAGGFKLDGRGPRQPRPRRTPDGRRPDRRQGQRHARAGRRVHQPPGRHALALPGHRPLKAKSMGVSLSDVFDTLQVYMGSLYVNNFNEFGRSWQVNVQADARFRHSIDDVRQLKVRNDSGPDGAAGHAGRGPRHQRPGDGRRATTCIRPRPSTATWPRAPAPGEAIGLMEKVAEAGAAPRRCGSSGPS